MTDLRSFEIPRMEPKGLDRRGFVKVVTHGGRRRRPRRHGRRADRRGRRRRHQALGDLAALPGVHRLHRVAAAHVAPRHRRADPRPHLARLPRDAVRRRRPPGRGRRSRPRWQTNAGKYICVVEGAIPTKDDGIYCKIGGRTAVEIVNEVAEQGRRDHRHRLLRVVGRHPVRRPEPDRRHRRAEVLKGKTVVTIPGCPANPYNFLGTVLQFVDARHAAGARREGPADVRLRPHDPRALPAARALRRRPLRRRSSATRGTARATASTSSAARARRRTRTARSCTSARSTDAWPIGLGHPCFGCTEQKIAFRVPLHDTVDIERPTPPDTYPPIHAEQGKVSAVATGVAGLVGGAALGAG